VAQELLRDGGTARDAIADVADIAAGHLQRFIADDDDD
jgi:hypothetical protein